MKDLKERYELEARYDTRQSFYRKAYVETQRNDFESTKDLYSYGTLVASIVCSYEHGVTIYRYMGKYSQTTTRHQKEFFRQNGLSEKQIKELFKKDDNELIINWRMKDYE